LLAHSRHNRGAELGNQTDVDSLLLERCRGNENPKRGAFGREAVGGGFGINREEGLKPKRGSLKESRLWAWARAEIPEGLGVQRIPRSYRERVTQ
jgi:hypothetical protein